MRFAVWSLGLLMLLMPPAQARCAAPTRFVLRGGEAFDPHTGLTWQRCSVGMIWENSAAKPTGQNGRCTGARELLGLREAKRHEGGDWRLPNVDELHGLLDPACGEPAIDTRVFPDVMPSDEGDALYWTTSEVGMLNLTYTVDFINGIVDGHSSGLGYAVRLVRGGRP